MKAQHTEMSKHVGDGNQNQPFYQTARLLLFAQIQPYYTEDHKQDYVYRQPVAHRKPWQRHPSATVGFNLAVDAHSAVTGALVNKLRKIDEQFMTILGLYGHILCAGFGEHPVPFFHVFKRNERKERMKKLIALLLAAVMCLSLAACDNGKTENTDHSQGQNTENTSKENQQTETASQGNGNTEC